MYLAAALLGSILIAQTPTGSPRVMSTVEPSPPSALEPIPDPAVRQPQSIPASPPPATQSIAAPAAANQPATKTVAPQEESAESDSPRRPLPPDMVAAALESPAGASLAGRRLTLLEALSGAFNRTQRLAITHAYWGLTRDVAEYYRCDREREALAQFQARAEDAAALRAALASAEAAFREAEYIVVRSQYQLAEILGTPTATALPLPADLPHVGPYRTYFDEVAARQALPPQTRLINRTFPIRRRAIDVWALAVQAADDAVLAIAEAYARGAADVTTVLDYRAQLGRRRQSFLAAVCDYNHDIAEYAMAVAGPETSAPVLVTMLIQVQRPAASRSTSGDSGEPRPLRGGAEIVSPRDSEVQPATLNEPLPATPTEPLAEPNAGRPTPAPPRESPLPTGEPTPAPPQESPLPIGEPTPAPPQESPTPAGEPAPVPPTESQPAGEEPAGEAFDPAAPAAPSLQLLVPIPASDPEPQPHTTNRVDLDRGAAAPSGTGMFPALVEAKPGVRAQRLAEALCRNRTLGEADGRSIALKDCLREAKISPRGELIEAFWAARQRAAEYEVLAMHADWLEELLPFALARRNQPGGPEEMLRLQAARHAARAYRLEMQMRLMEAQFELTRSGGLPLDAAWLLPATTPHAGPYLLNLAAQPPLVVGSWPVKRLAATIPALTASLQDRSAAVIEADSARAAATAAYQSGQRSIDHVLAAINLQTAETQAFLATLTDYNRGIAHYVLTVVSPAIPADQLAEALVVTK